MTNDIVRQVKKNKYNNMKTTKITTETTTEVKVNVGTEETQALDDKVT